MPAHQDVLPNFKRGILQPASIPLFSYEGNLSTELKKGLSPELAFKLLEYMMVIRSFEQIIVDIRAGDFSPAEGFKFVGATHLSLGQEAVAVGAISSIRLRDLITSTHRGHGHSVAKGCFALEEMSEEELADFICESRKGHTREQLLAAALQAHYTRTFAELFGKEMGYCRGRGGGMHIADFHVGHLGANAVVGGSSGIAVGAAIAASKLNTGQVALGLVGDGAVNNGVFCEALNMATMAQWEKGLPLVFLIENNQYGMTGQQAGEVTGVRYLSQRGAGYNDVSMHAETVNGMDVLAVRDAVLRAVEKCRKGEGPVLLECETYRWMGHSLSDSRTTYRSREEEAAWRAIDPIKTYSDQLVASGLADEGEIEEMRREARQRIEKAAREASRCPDPDPVSIYEGLYVDSTSDDIGEDWRTTNLASPPRKYTRDADGAIMLRHAVAEALIEEMIRDRRVVLYGEDLADYGGAFNVTYGLLKTFGRDRVWDTAISEACIVGSGVGAAMAGLRPVVELMYIDFILMAMDQVGNQAAKARYMFGGKATIPLVIRTTIGGGKGYAGQHSQSLEAVVTMFPGLKVVYPSTSYDAKGLLKTSIRDDNPIIFIEHQLLYTEKGVVPEEEYTIPLGVAATRKEGKDVTLVSYGGMMPPSLQAAEMAGADGLTVEVIDLRTLLPLDVDSVAQSVRKTGRLMLVTQAPEIGCFPEHVSHEITRCCFESLKAAPRIVAAHNVPPPMAQTLEQENIPSPSKIHRALLDLARE